MIESPRARWLGTRGRALAILVALTVSAGGLWAVSPALAESPTGDFAVFSQCPRFTAGVNLCLYARMAIGQVTLGRQTIPIASTITLQGGIDRDTETGTEVFVAALDGQTLAKAPQVVPGGLAGILSPGLLPAALEASYVDTVDHGFTSVAGTTELARSASEIAINRENLINQEGTGLSLPVKIHLTNPFLGSECYIGSSSSPLTLNLTTGRTSPPPPNRPITGEIGLLDAEDDFEFIGIPGTLLVDNDFSAPAATGCGGAYSYLLDSIIDRKIGLPSAAGDNTVVLESTIDVGTTTGVIASEK